MDPQNAFPTPTSRTIWLVSYASSQSPKSRVCTEKEGVAKRACASVRIADSDPCAFDPDNDGDVDEPCVDVQTCENDANSGEDNGLVCDSVDKARRRPPLPQCLSNFEI